MNLDFLCEHTFYPVAEIRTVPKAKQTQPYRFRTRDNSIQTLDNTPVIGSVVYEAHESNTTFAPNTPFEPRHGPSPKSFSPAIH